MLCVGRSSGAVHRKSSPVCRVDRRGSPETHRGGPVSPMVALQSYFSIAVSDPREGKGRGNDSFFSVDLQKRKKSAFRSVHPHRCASYRLGTNLVFIL